MCKATVTSAGAIVVSSILFSIGVLGVDRLAELFERAGGGRVVV